jgi:alpha-tubulin suppressor-like RCC1 family protein
VSPPQVNLGAIAGFNPAPVSLSLTSSVPVSWSASVAGANWLTLNAGTGVTPSTLTLTFNTAQLAAGLYTNRVDITDGPLTVQVPVILDIKPLNIVKMATDYQRPYIYALQAPALSGQNGQLLFINTTTEAIEKTLPIGFNPVDLTVHYGENRLYIASWTENSTYVVDLATQSLLPPLHLGTDVYKINSGRPGRVITEGEDQWIGVNIVDTASGTVVGSMPYPEREGDGETDPTGTFYYHNDNNISNAHIHKFQLVNDTATEVAGSLEHPYGSRNLVLAPDGTRLFWRGYVYDANLNELGNLGEEIYATTAHGDLALGQQHVFNSRNGQSLYTWPFSTGLMAVSGDQQKVFLYDSTANQLTVVPMSAIASVPGPGLNPTPANGAVINPPLAQVSWTASPFALSYQVFLGTDQAAVASADTNSPLYLGATSTNAFSLSGPLSAGSTYYWRVDSVGFSSITPGTVWSFTASAVSLSPQNLSLKGVVGLPLLPQSLSIASTIPTGWTMSIAQPWMSASAVGGTTPSTVALSFNTTNLTAGFYTNQLTVSANGLALQVAVVVQLFDLNASKIAVDPNRNYLYVLHPGTGSFEDAFLLFLNTDTGVVEKVIPIGVNPTDLTVSPFEDRLYVSNWQHNQTRVVDLAAKTELAPLALGTDVYKINAGRAGRLITEGEDQWIYVNLVDTTSGTNLASGLFREGDGQFDPSGRYYYHGDNNISGAGITKYDMSADTFASVVGAGGHYYFGSRNVVMSQDGSRLFWTSAMYDANLVDLGVVGAEIYSCSTNGSVAFGDHQAFDSATRQVIFNLPVTSPVSAVDRLDQQFWYFNSATHRIESVPLAVVRMPSITQQPAANTSVGIGGTVYLSATAMGLAPLSYQWILGGTNVSGGTNYFLSMNSVQPSQQGDYQVIVSNPFGAVTSAVAQVSVLVPPTITTQPQGTNVFAGQPFTLSVAAAGSPPMSCQWNFEGLSVSGATNFTLSVANAQAVHEGVYSAVVMNSAGSVTSAVALVRVFPAAATIVSGPVSATVPAASNVTFSVTATGSQPLSYQWLLGGTPLLAATAAQYSINDAQSWNAGNYQAVVANSFGAVTSQVATLAVTPVPPYFVTQPVGATLAAGTNLTLSALARGSEPIGYQWWRGVVSLAGANQSSLTLTNLQPTDSGGYTLVASSAAGVSTSHVATIVVTAAPPVFVQQPASAAVLAGSSLTLSSQAAGSAPLQYRWYFQNAPLLNQTNRQLTLNPVTVNAGGPYYVTASNVFAVATSSVAQVTVNQSPVFQQPLTNQVADVESAVVLSVTALGTPTLAYSWQLNGQPLAATGPTLTLTSVQPSQSGYYAVTVSNAYGTATSSSRVSVLGWPSAVAAWGDDSGGQTDVPANLNDVVAVAGGDFHTLALHRGGTLLAWGYNGDHQTTVPTNALKFVSFAAGAAHNLAIREDGSLVAWGRNDGGQCNVPAGVSNQVLCVAAGEAHSLALLASGSVVAWGTNTFGQSTVPQGLTAVRGLAAGRNHSLALRRDGSVVGWGFNAYGQASPPVLTNALAIAAGYLHSLALLSNGTVVVWGDNTYGQANVPVGLSNVVAVAAGDFHSLALMANGTAVGWGDDAYGQIDVPAGLPRVSTISAGNYHSLALMSTLGHLQTSLLSSRLVICWSGSGSLQWAPTPLGPYQDVGSPGTCYTNLDMSAPAKFFRLRP